MADMTAEQQHHIVGRLRAIEDSIKCVTLELPYTERHALDLLFVAAEATHRAVILLWGKAPEIPETPEGSQRG